MTSRLRGVPAARCLLVACAMLASGGSHGQSFWADMSKAKAQPVTSTGIDRFKLELGGIRLGMPALAAKRAITMTAAPALLTRPLHRMGIPAAYGYDAYADSPDCLQNKRCEARLRVLTAQSAVWYIGREALLGPFETEEDAKDVRLQLHAELVQAYAGLALATPGQGSQLSFAQEKVFLRTGDLAPPGHSCRNLKSVTVVGAEPISFLPVCGWQYSHSLSIEREADAYYVRGLVRLVELSMAEPALTEPAARALDSQEEAAER